MASSAPTTRLNNTVVRLTTWPFNPGSHYLASSFAGTTMYSIDHPGDQSATKYARFAQTKTGNKAFELPSGVTAPQNTTGGALAAANQLRVVALVNGVPPTTVRTRGDQVAVSTGFVVGAGGGTAVADATLSIKGTTAANLLVGSTSLSIASSGADTQTILVGDQLTVAGDSTVYTATATTATLNGTTEVNVAITPPVQVAQTAGLAVTVTLATGKTILLGTAPAVGSKVEVLVMDAGDVTTVTGGAMTAGRPYDLAGQEFYHSAGIVDFTRFM